MAGTRVMIVAPQPPPYGGMALQAGMLTKLLREDGVAVTLLPANLPFPRPLAVFEQIRGIRPFIRSMIFVKRLWGELDRADVLHIFAASWLYFLVVVYPAVLLGRLRGRRVVLNYRGGEADRFFSAWAWAIRPAFRLAHVITAPSEFLAEVIGKRFGLKVTIVPNILDLSRFCFRPRPKIQPHMLVTRHLEPMYDVESIVRAFGSVQQKYPHASLEIAGTGREEDRLRSIVLHDRLRNVRFLGHVAHESLPSVYERNDIFLNASRVDNFPAALLEASAAGLVVVSTGAGGIPFIYENGRDALLVPPGNWQGLADAVLTVLASPRLGQELIRSARGTVSKCDWTEVRKRLYDAYAWNAGYPAKEDRCAAG